MRIALGCFCLMAASAVVMPAQSFVQISTVRARPTALTCVGPGATSRVRVQVYVAGVPDSAKQSTMNVSLSVYSAHPSISKIDIRDATKEVALTESPALVDFDVNCTGDTLPGMIEIGATIASAPEGILIKEPATPAVIQLKILGHQR